MAGEELNSVKVEITINGKECDFLTLNLHQTLFGHHIFNIELNYRAKKLDVWTQSPNEILKELGNEVSIRISDRAGNTTEFVGIIKKVNIGGKHSGQGVVMLHGGSPTLLMTDDYSMNTFVDTDLASIVHETVTNFGLKIEHKIEPANNKTLPFVYRYKESSYGFLRRLTTACGEWFYYDGKKIVVGFSQEQGKKDIDNAVALTFRDDLEEMDISSTLGNYDIERYDYDPGMDRIGQFISYPSGYNLDTFTSPAFKKSQGIYKDYTVLPSRLADRSGGSHSIINDATYVDHLTKLSNGSLLTAKTRSCKAALGKVIFLESEKEKGSQISDRDRELGEFRIIEVNHTYDNGKKSYENNIVGVNARIDAFPNRDVEWPTALPEVATVVDNKDPEKMGRVKVQYMWQRLDDHPQDKTSGWIRVQTPDAGSSEAVGKNRGFFFVPEVGDQVMVNYEYGDPDRAFVAGSLFHKNNAGGIAGENDIKHIVTKSGISVTFDDKAGSLTLNDKKGSGNSITLNGNGEISLKAASKLTLECGEGKITMEKSGTITIHGDDDVKIESPTSIGASAKDINISGTNSTTIDGKGGKFEASGKVVISGTPEVIIN